MMNERLQPLHDPRFSERGVSVWVKREDLIDPLISGNKWWKLLYNLEEAKKQGFKRVLSFGGAYSNHILALAAAGQRQGLQTIGIIRGEEILPLNSTLHFAKQVGMQLVYVSRESYRHKEIPTHIAPPYFVIPEGGSNALAVKGCAEMLSNMPMEFDYICTAAGTGGTLAGILAGMGGRGTAIGVPVLKGGEFIATAVKDLLREAHYPDYQNFELFTQYHFGGYAKSKPELLQFIAHFEAQHGIRIEPVYTGKLFFALYDLILKGYFAPGTRLLAVHTGGLRPTSW